MPRRCRCWRTGRRRWGEGGRASETDGVRRVTVQEKIRPGYKQTEVGMIPQDWAVCALGEVVEFLDGKRRPVKSGDRAKMRGIFPYYGASGIIDT